MNDKNIQAVPEGGFDAEKLVRAIGLVFSNTFLYGTNHSVTKKAREDAYKILSDIFLACPEVSFNVTENALMVNQKAVEVRNKLMETFVSRLSDMDLNSFSLKCGMTSEKFEGLMDLFNSKPEDIKEQGGFAAAVAKAGLEYVRVTTISYVQVTEDEVVMSKDDAQEAQEAQEVQEKTAAAAATVETIMAFLRGDVSSADKNVVQGMEAAASSADKLGELILRSAEVKSQTIDLEGGETFAEVVVGCLRRANESLMQSPDAKTQKGKKRIKKTLMLLEKELLDKMRSERGSMEPEDEGLITEAIEEMNDELTIEALAEEYMKKRNAIDTNEKRIMRFIKSKGDKIGDTDLLGKLQSCGLSMEGWQDLIVKSGMGKDMGIGRGEGGGGIAAIGRLAMLLEHLEEDVIKNEEGGKETADSTALEKKLSESVRELESEVNNVVAETERKIDDLVQKVKEEEAAEEAEKRGEKKPKEQRMSRKQMVEFLAEIVQELCQPLAVIGCSVDMIISRSLGEITNAQEDMLKLATESGEKLQKLINKLMEISGLPTTLKPDSAIQASVYDK